MISMYKMININQKIRTFLAQQLQQFYLQTDDKEQALQLYTEYMIDLLLNQDNSLSQVIIGLCFSDSCRLFHFFNLYNRLSIEEKNLLKQLDQMTDIEEIETLWEENPRYFDMLIQAPLKFQMFSLRNQASMLLMDEKEISSFDKFHELEKHTIFQTITLNDIRNMYEKHNQKDNRGLDIAFEKLIILSIGNSIAFYNVLDQLVDAFYELSKYIEQQSIINLTDIHRFVIRNIESGLKAQLLYEIAYDEELLREILMIYLSLFPIYENTCEAEIMDKQKEI